MTFFVACLLVGGILDFYLGARFGPELFWGIRLDQVGQSSLLPDELTEEELHSMIERQQAIPLTFHDVLQETSVKNINEMRKSDDFKLTGNLKTSGTRPDAQGIKDKVVKPVIKPKTQGHSEGSSARVSPSKGFTLKVGAFSSLNQARKLEGHFLSSGFFAYTNKQTIPDKGEWYRVYVGRYPSSDTARREGERISRSFGLIPVVEQINSK